MTLTCVSVVVGGYGSLEHACTLGGVKQGRFVIFAFSLDLQHLGSQDTQMLRKTPRKTLLSHPFQCAPNASKK